MLVLVLLVFWFVGCPVRDEGNNIEMHITPTLMQNVTTVLTRAEKETVSFYF